MTNINTNATTKATTRKQTDIDAKATSMPASTGSANSANARNEKSSANTSGSAASIETATGHAPAKQDKAGAVRDVSPQAGAGPKVSQTMANGDDRGMRLAALRDLPSGAGLSIPDIRGWRVATSHGHIVGSVTRILVDQAQQNAPRYLEVLVEPTRVGLTTTDAQSVLVPIGRAQIAKDGKSVILPGLLTAQMPLLPRLGDGAVTWEYELKIASAFGQKSAFESPDALYASEIFNGELFRQRVALPA